MHLPISKDTKAQQEAQIERLLEEHQIDLVVLARYMQARRLAAALCLLAPARRRACFSCQLLGWAGGHVKGGPDRPRRPGVAPAAKSCTFVCMLSWHLPSGLLEVHQVKLIALALHMRARCALHSPGQPIIASALSCCRQAACKGGAVHDRRCTGGHYMPQRWSGTRMQALLPQLLARCSATAGATGQLHAVARNDPTLAGSGHHACVHARRPDGRACDDRLFGPRKLTLLCGIHINSLYSLRRHPAWPAHVCGCALTCPTCQLLSSTDSQPLESCRPHRSLHAAPFDPA